MKIKSITHATDRGARGHQEDRSFISHNAYGTLLAVFDGHGGDRASDYCEQNFARTFLFWMEDTKDPKDTLKLAFNDMAVNLKPYYEGTTASVVFIPNEGDIAITAVLGDSPVIIGPRNGVTWFGPDHNVRTNPAEADAAIERGGHISGGYLYRSYDGAGLQMGRALGDSFLGKVLSNEPEIDEVKIWPNDFILVATDGLFDPAHHGFKAAAKVILDKIKQGEPAEGLVKYAVELPTKDNVTCILARVE